jgi:hypothetical protein
VCAKSFMEHFSGFSLSTRSIGHGFFDADDVMALRALAEAMTGAIHFVLWSKPTRIGQFWFFHTPVSHRPNSLAIPMWTESSNSIWPPPAVFNHYNVETSLCTHFVKALMA